MTVAAIRQLLDQRLATLTTWPIFWENTPWKPKPGQAHLRTHLITAQPNTPGVFASATSFEQGIYQVDVLTSDDGGPAASDQMCDAVMDLFPRGLSLSSTMRLWVIERPDRAGAGFIDGWAAVPVSISYNAYLL